MPGDKKSVEMDVRNDSDKDSELKEVMVPNAKGHVVKEGEMGPEEEASEVEKDARLNKKAYMVLMFFSVLLAVVLKFSLANELAKLLR